MKWLLFALFAVSPPAGLKPSIEMSELKFFDGVFKCERKISLPADGLAIKVKVTGKVELEKFWLSMESAELKDAKHPLPHVSRGYWGYDNDAQQFTRMAAGNRGDWESATSGGWSGDTLTWSGFLSNYQGERVPFRHTVVKEGMREFSDKYEVNTSGEWRTLWQGKCTK